MTNAVVTQRDVAALRAAIVPNVRRIVPHDHTNLYLIDERRRLGPFVIDPTALAWPEAGNADPAGRGTIQVVARSLRSRRGRGRHARGPDRVGSAARARRGVGREADLQRAAGDIPPCSGSSRSAA